MTPELKRALRQLSMTLPEAEAFVRLRREHRHPPSVVTEAKFSHWLSSMVAVVQVGRTEYVYKLSPQGRFVAEALVRLGVGRKG